VHRPAPSHEVRHRSIGQAVPGAQGEQASPHAFPAHGSYDVQTGAVVTHCPPASQWPTCDGSMHGGVALRQGGSMTHSSPQAFPVHGAATGHVKVPCATQAPDGSHAFTTAVSTQLRSSGAQAVQAAPQAFAAQGSYG
jgi:hypothetical protein